jgi:hypothetical protein
MNNGWIKLHRNLQNHWIWRDSDKLKWWLDILLTSNHSDAKILIGNTLIECKRGQTIMSLSNWASRWNVSKDKARNFLVLLESDGMILHENIQKSTRITICNYESYQGDLHDDQTITKRYPNDKSPKQEEIKKNKEEKEYIASKNENLISLEKWMNENTPFVLKLRTQMTNENLDKLLSTYTKGEIVSVLENMNNYKPLLKNYTSVYLTLKNWLKKEYGTR